MEQSLRLVLQKLVQVRAAIAGTAARVEQVGHRAAQTGFRGIAEGMTQVRVELGRIDEMVAAQVTAVQDAIESIQQAANEPSPDHVVSTLASAQVGELVTGLGAVVPELDRLASQVEASLRGGRPGPLLALIGEVRRLVVDTIAVEETASRQATEVIARAQQLGDGSALVGASGRGGADGPASQPTERPQRTDEPLASARPSRGAEGGDSAPGDTVDPPDAGGPGDADVDVPEPDWTRPTGPAGGIPTGPPTKNNPQQEDDVRRSLERENDTARIMADQGYRVHQNPTPQQVADARAKTGDTGVPGKKPDYLIEGRVFDCYSPSAGTTVRNIGSEVAKKIRRNQTQRVVINLQDWDSDIDGLRDQFATWPIPRLKELKVVTADREIIQIDKLKGLN